MLPSRSSERSARRRRRRRGNVALLSALMLTVLLGFAALAVDLSNKYRVRTESQSAVDAAALAGARELRGTAESMTAADTAAREIGQMHYAYQADITMAQGDVEIGRWDQDTRTFTTPADPEDSNAVRVVHSEPEVAHPFAAPLTGTASSPVGARAIALGGGPSTVGCGFPMALASCTLEGGAEDHNCGGCLQMAADPSDNVGWSNFNGNTSVGAVTSALQAACFGPDGSTPLLDEDGNCAGDCNAPVAGDDQIQLGNGNNFTGNPNQFCELVKDLLESSPTRTFSAELPVFESGSAGNCDPRWSGEETVIGFARVEFLGAKCGNSDRNPIVPESMPAGCSAPADKYVIAQVECGTRVDAPAGGGFFGLWARPVLVD